MSKIEERFLNPPKDDPIEFEKTVKVGDEVEARWTNCFQYYRAKAVVRKVNRASFRVEIIDAENYLHGRSIPVPAFGAHTWSDNNRLAPVEDK